MFAYFVEHAFWPSISDILHCKGFGHTAPLSAAHAPSHIMNEDVLMSSDQLVVILNLDY